MKRLRNKNTKVVKEIEKEFEAAMYLGTGEWEIVETRETKETKETNFSKPPIIDTKSKEEK